MHPCFIRTSHSACQKKKEVFFFFSFFYFFSFFHFSFFHVFFFFFFQFFRFFSFFRFFPLFFHVTLSVVPQKTSLFLTQILILRHVLVRTSHSACQIFPFYNHFSIFLHFYLSFSMFLIMFPLFLFYIFLCFEIFFTCFYRRTCRSTALYSSSHRNRSTSSSVRKAGALVPPPSCLGGGPHGWVLVYTHSTPVLTLVRRLWEAQTTPRAQRSAGKRAT